MTVTIVVGEAASCIEVFGCVLGTCEPIGVGVALVAGGVSVPVSPALQCAEALFAVDNCAGRTGPVVVVQCAAATAAPVLTPRSMVLLVGVLGLVGLLALGRARMPVTK